ncbi:hypothetical protein PR048_001173 [Dryococelus australis]|uniref:Uncharacterized protein n=1 Tax=Dryococelus australis TaxID=614101 RepID=A0ABQ9IGL3_9NEOP|nr:hypothetical protein PR048_001173 [Dryococelus australis]
MSLIGGFSRGSSASPALAFRRRSILASFHPQRLHSALSSCTRWLIGVTDLQNAERRSPYTVVNQTQSIFPEPCSATRQNGCANPNYLPHDTELGSGFESRPTAYTMGIGMMRRGGGGQAGSGRRVWAEQVSPRPVAGRYVSRAAREVGQCPGLAEAHIPGRSDPPPHPPQTGVRARAGVNTLPAGCLHAPSEQLPLSRHHLQGARTINYFRKQWTEGKFGTQPYSCSAKDLAKARQGKQPVDSATNNTDVASHSVVKNCVLMLLHQLEHDSQQSFAISTAYGTLAHQDASHPRGSRQKCRRVLSTVSTTGVTQPTLRFQHWRGVDAKQADLVLTNTLVHIRGRTVHQEFEEALLKRFQHWRGVDAKQADLVLTNTPVHVRGRTVHQEFEEALLKRFEIQRLQHTHDEEPPKAETIHLTSEAIMKHTSPLLGTSPTAALNHPRNTRKGLHREFRYLNNAQRMRENCSGLWMLVHQFNSHVIILPGSPTHQLHVVWSINFPCSDVTLVHIVGTNALQVRTACVLLPRSSEPDISSRKGTIVWWCGAGLGGGGEEDTPRYSLAQGVTRHARKSSHKLRNDRANSALAGACAYINPLRARPGARAGRQLVWFKAVLLST